MYVTNNDDVVLSLTKHTNIDNTCTFKGRQMRHADMKTRWINNTLNLSREVISSCFCISNSAIVSSKCSIIKKKYCSLLMQAHVYYVLQVTINEKLSFVIRCYAIIHSIILPGHHVMWSSRSYGSVHTIAIDSIMSSIPIRLSSRY